jgi:hypothetical protein
MRLIQRVTLGAEAPPGPAHLRGGRRLLPIMPTRWA